MTLLQRRRDISANTRSTNLAPSPCESFGRTNFARFAAALAKRGGITDAIIGETLKCLYAARKRHLSGVYDNTHATTLSSAHRP